jgi:hypothetical protein
MNRFLTSFLVFGFLLTFNSPSLAHDGGKNTGVPMPGINVLVYDHAQVPGQTLNRTEWEVTRIFHDAGIGVTWRNCDTAITGIHQEVNCTQEVTPTELILRILPEIPVVPGLTHDSTMGFAVGNLASVSFCRVKAEAGKFGVNPYAVLGPAIAHEIGHLLLGSQGHSPTGIMRASWQRRDYEAPPLGAFKFTAGQAVQMRAEVKRRVQEQGATEVAAATATKY